jgi:hypothetical protein
LRKKAIDSFTEDDLRFMIGQNIGTAHLMLRVMGVLESNPLVEGNYYPGDLLATVLRLPDKYWTDHPDHLRGIIRVTVLLRERVGVARTVRAEEARQFYGAQIDGHDRDDDKLEQLIDEFISSHNAG